MRATYKEAAFSVDYREQEVGRIMDAVAAFRSIAIIGLAGMGKSNIVRFIVSHPQVREHYLKDQAKHTAFVHVDCASLIEPTEREILHETAFLLIRDGIPSIKPTLPQNAADLRRSVRELILSVESSTNLVLVLDYFEEAAVQLSPTFFNYLFHLRNTRQHGNLSNIFVTRRPMARLGELQELLDDACVITPLGIRDALESIQRHEVRLGCTFNAAQRDTLVVCTGGHPGLLKNAAELLKAGRIDITRPTAEIAREMLQSSKVKNLCDELWNDLLPAEQAVLLNSVLDTQPTSRPAVGGAAYLERYGILVAGGSTPDEAGLSIFCPLFEVFIRHIVSNKPDTFRVTAIAPNQARIETEFGNEQARLSPLLFAVLSILAEAEGQVVPTDEIIEAVYGDEAEGISDAALSQLVKRLRGVIDPCAQRLTDNPDCRCIETVRGIGYRLAG